MAGNSGQPGRTVTSKLTTILIALMTGCEHTTSSLARQTNLPTSTVHRLLVECVRFRLVERTDSSEYRPGPVLRNLECDAEQPSLLSRAPLTVDDLAAALRKTVRLGLLDGRSVTYMEKKPGPVAGTMFPNSARLPAHATALGKALIAFAPGPLVDGLISNGLMPYTSRTLTSGCQLHNALNRIRARGFAIADREFDLFSSAVAAPVFNATGTPIAAIEVQVNGLGPETLASVVPALMVATRALTRELFQGALESSREQYRHRLPTPACGIPATVPEPADRISHRKLRGSAGHQR
jgi:DNA-binding IclR family transcriptional regulator